MIPNPLSARRHVLALALAAMAISGTAAAAVAPAPDTGPETARLLGMLYRDTRPDCGAPSRPAFLCSGIVLRATWPSTDYMFYSISPTSQASGGVSASYLRRDAKFRKLAYGLNSGFIFDTIFENPRDHYDHAVLCAFPLDGITNERNKQGCGDSSRTPDAVEKPCHMQGVDTARHWASDYRRKGSDRSRQCGFDVRDGRNSGTAQAFYQSIRAMAQIPEASFRTQNELRIAPWPQDPPRSPSLLALFYTEDAGRDAARLSQVQWYRATTQRLPIIHLKLPRTRGDDAQFDYRADQQAIQPAEGTPACERYVASAHWTEGPSAGFDDEVASLQIVPTDCGRAVGDAQTAHFFNELAGDYLLDTEWKDNPQNRDNHVASMRRQLACHLETQRTRETWTLEPARPVVSQGEAIARGCDNR